MTDFQPTSVATGISDEEAQKEYDCAPHVHDFQPTEKNRYKFFCTVCGITATSKMVWWYLAGVENQKRAAIAAANRESETE
ncbi:MAG: hypothetical protein ACYTBJ_26390 [Planctomycetota bacterium]